MENRIKVFDENGNEINIEVILGFEVKELNKKYIACTLNYSEANSDDDEMVDVLIS